MGQYRSGGEDALQKAGRAGRKPELSEEDRARLEELSLRGPENLGYETPLWTCARLAHLIDDEFGVKYHPGHVWKVSDLGWSCQRPTGRAREWNEEEIRRWRRVQWPAIKKPSSGQSVGDAGFLDAWKIALEMSVSHTVSADSRLLLTC